MCIEMELAGSGKSNRQGKLGVIGGMGPQATQLFYQFILDNTEASTDQENLPAVILSDTHIPDRTAAILSGDTQAVFSRLLHNAKLLEGCGCSMIAIPCNTSHYFVDRLQEQVGIPILHMIREAVGALRADGVKRVGILATDGTNKTGIYARECALQGLEAVAPDADIQKTVMSIIYDDIKSGGKGSLEKFAPIDQAMRRMKCEKAVLACTELSVFSTYWQLPDYYLDPMLVAAKKAIVCCGYPLKQADGFSRQRP